jgi:hypothetical protein
MPTYRLYDAADGNDMGEMRLGDVPFNPGDEIHLGPGRTLRVISVIRVEDESVDYAGALRVERVERV